MSELAPATSRGQVALLSTLIYGVGAGALGGGLTPGACAVLIVAAAALLPGLPGDEARARRWIAASCAVALAALESVSPSATLTAALGRGPFVRLAWGVLCGVTGWSLLLSFVPPALRLQLRARLSAQGPGRSALVGLASALGAGGALLAWQVRGAPLGPDSGVNVLHGVRVLEGAVPYLDFQTLYHPGFCYTEAAWLLLLGPPSGAVLRAVVVLQHLLVAAGLAWVLFLRQRWGAAPLAALIGLYLLVLAPTLEGLSFVLEPMISLPGWAGLGLASWLGGRLRGGERESPLAVGAGAATGLLAGWALATKQPGGVFLIVVPLVHLDAGRLARRVLVAQLCGLILVPAWFFGAHPAALHVYWDQSVGKLFSYAQGDLVPPEPAIERVRALVRNALIPLCLLAAFASGLAAWRSPRDPWRETRGQRAGDLLLLLAGLASLLPSLLRPYLHYYLLAAPFLPLALGALLRDELGRERTSRGAWLIGSACLGALACGLSPLVHDQLEGLRAPERGAQAERDLARFMQDRLAGRQQALILPNVPQYYLLTGTRSPAEVYSFVDSPGTLRRAEPSFEAAWREGVPVFVVDRGGPGPQLCRERLRELGWELRGAAGPVEHYERGGAAPPR